MSNLDPIELSRQLKKPTGKLGNQVGKKLNESNRELYKQAWEMADFSSVQQILEIGFGNGKHLSKYFELNPDITVTGIDFSKEMCKEARGFHPELVEAGKLQLHCADSSSMPVNDHSHDFVIGLNLLYFWDPPGAHLKEIARVLKPQSKLLLGYRPRHAVEHMAFTKQNFILYEPEELEDLLPEYGFNIISHQQNRYAKQAADGTDVEVTDICLMAEPA